MIKYILSVIIILNLLTVSACSKKEEPTTQNVAEIITVKKETITTPLFFNGVVSPIRNIAVISPISATVDTKSFTYGERVKKGQVLMTLSSSELDKTYQDALSSYLTAKAKYESDKSDIVNSDELFKAGIIPRNTYNSAHNDLNNSYLSFLQARRNLYALLKKTQVSPEKIALLRIGESSQVEKFLSEPISKLSVYASAEGIALKPSTSAGRESGGEQKEIDVGSQVKEGQTLLTIGDMSGIRIRLFVNEINVEKIVVGEKAIITSSAFPSIQLNGVVTYVSKQAVSGESGSLPTFPISVYVFSLKPSERTTILAGMSVKVQLNIEHKDVIQIPINAIHEKGNKPFVTIKDLKTGETKDVPIEAGETTENAVVINRGLKPGDQIVFSH